MLVLVHVSDFHLTHRFRGQITPCFGQDPDLKPPIRRDAQIGQGGDAHGEFPRQRIAERPQEIEVIAVPDHLFQRDQQGADQQAADPPVQLAPADAGIIPFGQLIGEIRIGQRIDQPRQHIGGIGDDVAIVQGHNRAVLTGKGIAQTEPHIAPLSRFAGIKVQVL